MKITPGPSVISTKLLENSACESSNFNLTNNSPIRRKMFAS
jgi:hypothetical protein